MKNTDLKNKVTILKTAFDRKIKIYKICFISIFWSLIIMLGVGVLLIFDGYQSEINIFI